MNNKVSNCIKLLVVAGFTVSSPTVAQPQVAHAPWYLSASGGYSSGWDAARVFVFRPSGEVIVALGPLVQKVSAHSKPIAGITLGYEFASARPYRFKAEIERLYLPQEITIDTTSSPVSYTALGDTIYHTKRDDNSYLAGFGVTATKLWLSPSLMVGIGRNSSDLANSSAVWQAKAGIAWILRDRVSFTIDARYLRVSDYSVSGGKLGPYSVGRQYDFGSLDSISGTFGIKVRF